MTSRLCTACDTRLPDDTNAHACPLCLDRLRGLLAEIPRHLPLLAELLAPGTTDAPGPGGTGRAHSPMPVRGDVLNLLGPGAMVQLPDPHGDQDHTPGLALLRGWADYIATTAPAAYRDRHGTVQVTPCTAPVARHGTGPAAWCRWLTAYLPQAAEHDWYGEMYRQIEALVWVLRGKTNRQPRRTARSAPCPACEAFALVSTEGEPLTRCEACGQQLTAAEYRDHSAKVLPALTALAVRLAAAA